MSRESSQSLSSVNNKSVDTHQSLLSHKIPSHNDVREKKSTSSIAPGVDEQSLKGSYNPNPISYKIHVSHFFRKYIMKGYITLLFFFLDQQCRFFSLPNIK